MYLWREESYFEAQMFKACFIFQENVTSENVVQVSENLTQIVSNVTLNNTGDIVTVTSVVTKIINALSGTQISENEVNTFLEINFQFGSNHFSRAI